MPTLNTPRYHDRSAPISVLLVSASRGLFLATALLISCYSTAQAQVEPPDRRYLFSEDKELKKAKRRESQELQNKQRKLEQKRRSKNQPFDINAKTIDYDSTGKVISGEGGLIMSYSSAVLEAERGAVNIEEKSVELSGDVRITDLTGSLAAQSAKLQLEEGTGELEDADIRFEEGDYQLSGKKIRKLQGETFEFENAKLTTCDCPTAGECPPWRLDGARARVTKEGYGQVWHGILRAYDVPIFYTPYLVFPVKNQRQSGLLPGNIGTGKNSGLTLKAPFFWNINRSTDATLTGIVETNTRYGLDTEFRKLFSAQHNLDIGFTYLNESPRGDDLQGTSIKDPNDPQQKKLLDGPYLKENRLGGYAKYNLRSELGALPAQVVVDGRFVNNDLMVREFENDKIGPHNARYLTSRGVFRTFYEDFSFDGGVEYTQALVSSDDEVFQRLPETLLYGLHTFRPFGHNPFGVKLVVSDQLEFVNFSREAGYYGDRVQLRESVKIPFHFRNYFDTATTIGVRATSYSVNDIPTATDKPDSNIADSSSRILPDFGFTAGTTFERIYDASEDNLLKTVVEFGQRGRAEQLARLRHTIEPSVRYRYVPLVDQKDNPQFDSEDRLPRKNVATYQLTQRLFSRFEPREEYLYGVEEAAPTLDDLGSLRSTSPIDDAFDYGSNSAIAPDFRELRRGSKRELVSLKIAQSFDLDEARNDRDPERRSYSDVGAQLKLFANEYVRFEGRGDFDTESQDFNSFGLGTQLLNKREDQVRVRYNFNDGTVRQIESGIEFKLSERLKTGYYLRYDQREKEFIEQRAGIRMYSACNCWIFDLDVSDRIDPNETKVSFNITLVGLGEFGNSYFTDLFTRRQQTSLN